MSNKITIHEIIEAFEILRPYLDDMPRPAFFDGEVLIFRNLHKRDVKPADVKRLAKLGVKWDKEAEEFYTFFFL